MHLNIKVTKGIGTMVVSNMRMGLVTRNSVFCKKFFSRFNMAVLSDEVSDRVTSGRSLVYDMSKTQSFDSEVLQNIIDLLMQLRATQSDQNVIVQNNTVIRHQILNQLKNELFNVQNRISRGNLQKLEVVSNNLFDEDTLNDLLRSLMEESKKKSSPEFGQEALRLHKDVHDNVDVSTNILRNYTRLVNLQKKYTDVINSVSRGEVLHRTVSEKRLINLKRTQVDISEEDLPSQEKGKDKNINKVFVKEKLTSEIAKPIEEITKVYHQRNLINKITENVKSKVVRSELHRGLYNRDFNYLIQKNIKDRYEKLIESSDNVTISSRVVSQSNLVNRKNIKETEEEQDEVLSRVSYITERTSHLKRQLDKNTEKIHNVEENLLVSESTKNNISDIYDKVTSRNIVKKDINRIASKINFVTKQQENLSKVQKKDISVRHINDIVSYIDKVNLVKENLIKTFQIKNVNRVYSDIQKKIDNKYITKDIDIRGHDSVSRIVNKVKLVNRIVDTDVKLKENENRIEEINDRVDRVELRNQLKNKVSKIDNSKEIVRVKTDVLTEVHNKHKNILTKVNEINNIKDSINKQYVDRKETLVNRNIENKKSIIEDINNVILKTDSVKNYKNLVKKIKFVENKNVLSKKIENDIVESNINKLSKNITKVYLENISKKSIKDEDVNVHIDNIRKSVVDRIKEKQIATKNTIATHYNETLAERNIEKVKEFIIKKSPTVNYEEIESKINTASEVLVKKSLNSVIPKRIKKTLYSQNKILNVKEDTKNFVKNPLVVRENIKTINNIEKIVSRKFLSILPPDIRKINNYSINEKNIYREIQETTKSYFDDIQDRVGEKIILNRNKVYEPENIYRDIERDSVIFRSPISLESIGKIVKEDAPKEKPKVNRSFRSDTFENNVKDSIPVDRKTVSHEKVRTLKEEDVVRMIESYMSNIDINSISDAIVERVENQMEHQRRRNGIL